MDEIAVARALHVLGVVIWIGGVALITTAILPLLRHRPPDEAEALFAAIEGRFVWQARIAVLVVGGSGFYIVWRLHLWDRFREPTLWWMHAMVLVWLIFAAVLFVAEPLGLDRRLRRRRNSTAASGFARLERLHWVLLGLSVATILAAVLGSNGVSLTP
jgi:uncharacterized membrane protein